MCVSLFTMWLWVESLISPLYKTELVLEPKGFLMNKTTDIPIGISQSPPNRPGTEGEAGSHHFPRVKGPTVLRASLKPKQPWPGTTLGVSPTCPSTALRKSLSLLSRISLALWSRYDSHIEYSADLCIWIASVTAQEPCRNLAEPLRDEAQQEEEDLWGPCGSWVGPVFWPNHACLLCRYVSKQPPYTPAVPELPTTSPHYDRSNFFSL